MNRLIRLLFLTSIAASPALHAKKVYHVVSEEPTRRAPQQIINTGVSLNQQISSSTLNNTYKAVDGQFVIKTSGRYFLSTDLHAAPGRSILPIIYIAASDVILDLGGKSMTLSTSNYMPSIAAISLANGVNNITIMNGTINGKGARANIKTGITTLNNTNVMLDNVRIVNCEKTGIDFNTVNSFSLNGIQTVGGTIGISMLNSNVGVITDSAFDATFGGNNQAIGVLADSCSNVELDDLSISNNESTNNDAFGLYLIDSSGFSCKKVQSSRHTSGAALCAGIYLSGSTGNMFTECDSSNNVGNSSSTDVYGFYLTNESNGNSLRECEANTNGNSSTKICAGFANNGAHYNLFQKCLASGNMANDTAYGFFSTGASRGSVIRDCRANGNNIVETGGSAYGIAFEDETGGAIQNCEASTNTGADIGCGIALLGRCLKTTVEYNKILANAGTTRYGFWDDSTEATTFLRGNISFGHGKVYDGTQFIASNTTANYRLTAAETNPDLNPQYFIKEADTSNMNAFEAASPTWFNFSIIESLISDIFA